ncbi:MAG: tRNA dihydrouridine synthase DusB [Pseudomonadota bacterium]
MEETSQRQALQIAGISLDNPVMLAPMSGVTDLPFRRLALSFGAGAVVSEMVASKDLVSQRPHVLRRIHIPDDAPLSSGPNIVQLAGSEAHWMAEGARQAEALGAGVIDINMGCPAREVTGKQSGSALMRDVDHASTLIKAVVEASKVPVTLKMRLGWDDRTRNAPELAKRAEDLGVSLITVHGRTRCQFFKDKANWRDIADVKAAVSLPVVANGDINSPADAQLALIESGADGVMVGRGAYGAPWLPGRIAETLRTGVDPGSPSLDVQEQTACSHVQAMLAHYGSFLGLRNARKHIGWYLESAGCEGADLKSWRRRLCTAVDPNAVLDGLAAFYALRRGQATHHASGHGTSPYREYAA